MPTRIGFIGLLPYPPNQDGVTWFIRRVWPLIKRDVPRAELRLVGRGSDSHFTKLGPDIVGLGWLEDPGDEIGPEAPGSPHMGLWFYDADGYRWELSVQGGR